MISKYASSLALAMLLSVNIHAEHEHHHDRHEEKIEVKIDTGHCHQKERGILGKFAAGSVQLVENNAYLLSCLVSAGYGYWAGTHSRFRSHRDAYPTLGKAAAIWIGGGLATRNILRAVMSQCDIPKL